MEEIYGAYVVMVKRKQVEENRLCHSGNRTEYIYTHTQKDRLPHSIIMIKQTDTKQKTHIHSKISI